MSMIYARIGRVGKPRTWIRHTQATQATPAHTLRHRSNPQAAKRRLTGPRKGSMLTRRRDDEHECLEKFSRICPSFENVPGSFLEVREIHLDREIRPQTHKYNNEVVCVKREQEKERDGVSHYLVHTFHAWHDRARRFRHRRSQARGNPGIPCANPEDDQPPRVAAYPADAASAPP